MEQIDLIIFDLDGTLVDSRKDIVNAVNFSMGSLGLETKTFSEVVSMIGTGVTDLLKKALGAGKENLLGKAVSVFEEYYKKHAADETTLYPHVEDVLDYFGKKTKIIVTNRKKNLAEATLESFGIDRYFEHVIGGDDDTCLKPGACPIGKGLDALTAVDKRKSIMVGDMDVDILAGKEAGILTCGVTYGIGKKQDILNAAPDHIIDDIIELKNIIC